MSAVRVAAQGVDGAGVPGVRGVWPPYDGMRVAGFLAVLTALAAAVAPGSVSLILAQGAGVEIVALDCLSIPEVITITNLGTAPQSLTDWTLQSDSQSVRFDLSPAGVLDPGESIFVQAGPQASGAFVWSAELVLRDGDVSDYASIVDSAGDTVHQVTCAPEPAGTPSPTPVPAPGVPNGGGLPPPEAAALTPGAMVLIGGFMAAAGLACSLIAWPRRTAAAAVGPARALSGGAAARPLAARGGSHPGQMGVLALAPLIVLAGSMTVALIWATRRRKRQ